MYAALKQQLLLQFVIYSVGDCKESFYLCGFDIAIVHHSYTKFYPIPRNRQLRNGSTVAAADDDRCG